MSQENKKHEIESVESILSKSRVSVDKKSNKVVIEGHETLADQIVNAKKSVAEAKAVETKLELLALQIAEKQYQEQAKNDNYVSSVYLKGNKFDEVNISWQDKFSAIPIQQKDALISAIADSDSPEDLAKAKSTLDEIADYVSTVKLVATDNHTIQLINELLKLSHIFSALPEDYNGTTLRQYRPHIDAIRELIEKGATNKFEEAFSVDESIVFKKGLAQKLYSLPESFCNLVKQAKAAIKVSAKIFASADASQAIQFLAEEYKKENPK